MTEEDDVTAGVYADLLQRSGESHPRPRIEPARRLAELSGLPEKSYPMIHIAGTNGKTSTARVIDSVLRAHGLRTGLMTSPHLVSFRERIQIDGEFISSDLLTDTWDELQLPLRVVDEELGADGQGPITFFEALTVLAYAAFADAPVDVSIIEVGMGGEWDATNLADADVAVFTPIAIDHTEILGDSLAQIAETKAGIIKAGSVVVSAPQDDPAMAEIVKKSEALGAPLYVAGKDFLLEENRGGVGGRLVTVRGPSGSLYEPAYVPLFGSHQAQNVLLGVAAVEAFLGMEQAIPGEVLAEGLGSISSPGRLQVVGQDPTVLVDAAHNPHGAAVLAAALQESFDFEEITCVFGSLRNKNAEESIRILAPLMDQLFLVPIQSERAMGADELAERIAEVDDVTHHTVTTFDDIQDAIDEARDWAKGKASRGVIVAGSVLLAGEAIEYSRTQEWGIHRDR